MDKLHGIDALETIARLKRRIRCIKLYSVISQRKKNWLKRFELLCDRDERVRAVRQMDGREITQHILFLTFVFYLCGVLYCICVDGWKITQHILSDNHTVGMWQLSKH